MNKPDPDFEIEDIYDDLDLLKYMPFVENGITFKGLDV